MKYIIVEGGDNEYAILFDEILYHDKVAGSRRVVSAGFCRLEIRMGKVPGDACEIVPVAYGKSVSLGLESRSGKDSVLIAAALRRRI